MIRDIFNSAYMNEYKKLLKTCSISKSMVCLKSVNIRNTVEFFSFFQIVYNFSATFHLLALEMLYTTSVAFSPKIYSNCSLLNHFSVSESSVFFLIHSIRLEVFHGESRRPCVIALCIIGNMLFKSLFM